MNIEEELKEAEAIRATFERLIAHGVPTGKNKILVSVTTLVEMESRIAKLRADLVEALEESRAAAASASGDGLAPDHNSSEVAAG